MISAQLKEIDLTYDFAKTANRARSRQEVVDHLVSRWIKNLAELSCDDSVAIFTCTSSLETIEFSTRFRTIWCKHEYIE